MIGEEVRRRREELGLTGAQLAERANLAPSAVSQIETGKRSPSSNSIVKLAEALGVEVGELFPKAQTPLQLEFEEQAGVNDQELNKPEEDAAERREKDEKLVIALIMNWTEAWESFEDELKSETEGLPLGAAHHFGIDHMGARLLYEEYALSDHPSDDLQEAWETFDALSRRISALLDQLMHPGDKEKWDQRQLFAQRRAEVQDTGATVETADIPDLRSKGAG